MERYRYIKFGIVGASGTVVNLVVLYLGHEYLFNHIEADYKRPYLSLALAIFLATINNFTWNRLWTWRDRVAALAAQLPQGRARHPGDQCVLCLARWVLSVLERLIVRRTRQASPGETDWAREASPRPATRRRSNSDCRSNP